MRGILLIPAPEWRDRLLAAGACGARVPIAYRHEGGPWFGSHADAMAWHLSEDPRLINIPPEHIALALVWDGKPVAEGIFRAWNHWSPDNDPEFEATRWTTYDVLGEALDSLRGCEWLARACERIGLGRVEVLP